MHSVPAKTTAYKHLTAPLTYLKSAIFEANVKTVTEKSSFVRRICLENFITVISVNYQPGLSARNLIYSVPMLRKMCVSESRLVLVG